LKVKIERERGKEIEKGWFVAAVDAEKDKW